MAITRFTVLDRDGKPKTAPGTADSRITGDVELAGGAGFDVSRDSDSGELLVAYNGNAGVDDPAYKAKWDAILNGTAGFSGPPYYMSKLNGVSPMDGGTLMLMGGLGTQIGLFENREHPVINPAPDPNTLHFFDMCQACLDCGDYEQLYKYLERIKVWLDANKDCNLITGTKLFKQYQATVHYWNYLVHAQSLIFKVFEDGKSPGIKIGYNCIDCGPFTDVRMVVTVEQVSGYPSLGLWRVNGVSRQPGSVAVTVETSGDSSDDSYPNNALVVAIDSIDKKEYAIVDAYYRVSAPPQSSSSSSGSIDSMSSSSSANSSASSQGMINTWKITATWYNTHVGASASRTKYLETAAVVD